MLWYLVCTSGWLIYLLYDIYKPKEFLLEEFPSGLGAPRRVETQDLKAMMCSCQQKTAQRSLKASWNDVCLCSVCIKPPVQLLYFQQLPHRFVGEQGKGKNKQSLSLLHIHWKRAERSYLHNNSATPSTAVACHKSGTEVAWRARICHVRI